MVGLQGRQGGVNVEILFLDPTGQAVKTREKEDHRRSTTEAIRSSIKYMWEMRQKLTSEGTAQARLQLFVYDATPSSGLTWIDDTFMVVTHYLAGFANVTSPALIVKPTATDPDLRDLYRTYEENVSAIRKRSTAITPENVAKYLPKEEHTSD